MFANNRVIIALFATIVGNAGSMQLQERSQVDAIVGMVTGE